MEERIKTEQQMIRYLLGEMSIDEQVAIETGYFTDPEKFDMLQVVEQDLIEGYINNKLSASGRTKFEQHFLSTPARREQVRFFKTLSRALPFNPAVSAEMAAAAAQEPIPAAVYELRRQGQQISWWEVVIAPFRAHKLALGMSFAAALLVLAVAGSWLLMGTRRQEERNLANLNPPADQGNQAGELKQGNAAKSPGHDNQGNDNQGNDNQGNDNGSSSRPAVKGVIASFYFTIPAGARGAVEVGKITPQVLRIPASADSVQLIFNHQDGPYPRYRVSLQTLAGKQLWTRTEVKTSRVKAGTSLALNVPAGQFKEGSYIVSVSRNNTEGEWVVFHEFYIDVVR